MVLAPGAIRRAAIPLVLAVPGLSIHVGLGVALALLGVAILAFHRDPERTPEGPGALSPADGTVTVVREEGDRLRVGVFMNVWDVHVNRAPLAGEVADATHEAGANRPAFSKESDRNERLTLDFGAFEVVLIAGWFARRIVPYVSVGDAVERCERVGHVTFGSRADVVLPPSYDRADLAVAEGETVRAGQTVIARPPDASGGARVDDPLRE